MKKKSDIRKNAATPNDPKLSERGGWRGLRRRVCGSGAQTVTAVAVRWSAWLGVIGCGVESNCRKSPRLGERRQANAESQRSATTRRRTTPQAQRDYWCAPETLTELLNRLQRLERRRGRESELSAPMPPSGRMRLCLIALATRGAALCEAVLVRLLRWLAKPLPIPKPLFDVLPPPRLVAGLESLIAASMKRQEAEHEMSK